MKSIKTMSAAEKKAMRQLVESALAKYRLYKYLSVDVKEARIIRNYGPRYHGDSNELADQTAQVAICNVDTRAEHEAHCKYIEQIVDGLPEQECFLIRERYMGKDSEYITDYSVYCNGFNPPISERTYAKIRWKAMHRLAIMLGISKYQ